MTEQMPAENTFDHLRNLDGEHVGYIHMTEAGEFVPFDLPTDRLHQGAVPAAPEP